MASIPAGQQAASSPRLCSLAAFAASRSGRAQSRAAPRSFAAARSAPRAGHGRSRDSAGWRTVRPRRPGHRTRGWWRDDKRPVPARRMVSFRAGPTNNSGSMTLYAAGTTANPSCRAPRAGSHPEHVGRPIDVLHVAQMARVLVTTPPGRAQGRSIHSHRIRTRPEHRPASMPTGGRSPSSAAPALSTTTSPSAGAIDARWRGAAIRRVHGRVRAPQHAAGVGQSGWAPAAHHRQRHRCVRCASITHPVNRRCRARVREQAVTSGLIGDTNRRGTTSAAARAQGQVGATAA